MQTVKWEKKGSSVLYHRLIWGPAIDEMNTFGWVKNPLGHSSPICTTAFGLIMEDNGVHQ
jgi:hypothetical protein